MPRAEAGDEAPDQERREEYETEALCQAGSRGAAPMAPPDMATAHERFVSDLLIRGEAAKRDRMGKLPLRATHVIKKRKPRGSAEVERVRFKTF